MTATVPEVWTEKSLKISACDGGCCLEHPLPWLSENRFKSTALESINDTLVGLDQRCLARNWSPNDISGKIAPTYLTPNLDAAAGARGTLRSANILIPGCDMSLRSTLVLQETFFRCFVIDAGLWPRWCVEMGICEFLARLGVT